MIDAEPWNGHGPLLFRTANRLEEYEAARLIAWETIGAPDPDGSRDEQDS